MYLLSNVIAVKIKTAKTGVYKPISGINREAITSAINIFAIKLLFFSIVLIRLLFKVYIILQIIINKIYNKFIFFNKTFIVIYI